MCVMCRTVCYRPILHCRRYRICHTNINLCTFINCLSQRLVYLRRQICFHHSVIKYQTSKIIRNRFHMRILLVSYLYKEKTSSMLFSIKDAFVFHRIRCFLYNTLCFHCIYYLLKSGNVSTNYIITLCTISLSSISHIMADINHDIFQFCINFCERPA